MTREEFSPVVLQLVVLGFFTNFVSSEDLLLNLNPKKVVAVTSDKFLSLTIDPAVLLTGDVLTSSTELSTNMAKALAPGYVRLAGPRSNSYTFERSLFPQSGYEDPDLTFSEAHWVLVQQWAQRAGLDVVASLNPRRIENGDQDSSWDPRNSLELISFSDHMGYNISWQLGYECQTRYDVSGADLGKDVTRLRNMLAAFPRYSNSIIAGPDFVSLRGKQQQQYIQDYLNAAGNALSVITWHPDFAGIALDSDGVALQVDTLASDKDLLYKSMGRSVAKKPLWIAESKPEECKRQFLGALVWARRLGSAAKLGVQVIMRQPDASNLFQPTPDYWVSLLHKMLVGREVLDTKLTSGNKTHVHFYCQCTKPSAKYDRGAITIFGINLTPGKVSVALKGLKMKAVHKYILMPGFDTDNRMFAETVLLNNEPLTLENGKNLPEINPAVGIMGKNMAVKLPSGGIGFWVIPGARVKLCMGHDEETLDKTLLLKKFAKKVEEPEAAGEDNSGHELEEDNQDFEADSAEDIKSLLKSKKKKRRNRHSDEAEDEERRFKRIDTKKELEKLEKLLKRNSEDKKPYFKGRVGLSTIFESEETKEADASEEEAGLVQFKSEKTNSGEDIRAKLEEYKHKMMEYETARKKKQDAKNEDLRLERMQKYHENAVDDRFPSDVDTQKALEALALISKVESSIGEFEKEDLQRKNPLELTATDIGEEMLIEELERSDKIKRMIDPESFGKLYQYLVKNGQTRDAEGLVRPRGKRDLEKLLGDDPLGLRKEGLFKKRLKNDEAKERRLERRMRKKEKDEIGIKKELPIPRYEPRTIAESNENNFFGFPQMKPLENFPEGDLFISEGTSSEEKSNDYDYVKDDDDEEDLVRNQKQKNVRRRGKGPRKTNKPVNEADQTWPEEPGSNPTLNYVPNEFFERLNLPKVAIKSQWKDYGELYEPESLQQKDFKEDEKNTEDDAVVDTVIARDRPDEREDKRAKETAVKKLINYYDNSEVLKNDPIFEEKSKPKARKHGPRIRPAETHTTTKGPETSKKEAEVQNKKLFEKHFEPSEEDLGSMEFFSSKSSEDYSEDADADYVEEEIVPKKRPKRKVQNLDEIFKKEMIREDAGNSKDCKCRVIRTTGRLDCKNCRKSRRRRPQRDLTSAEAVPDLDSNPDPVIVDDEIPADEDPETREAEVSSDGEEPTLGSQKNTEVADLNGETVSVEDPVENGEELIPGESNPSNDDAETLIAASSEAAEPTTQLENTEPPVISGLVDEETEANEPTDDVVGSVRQSDDGETIIIDQKTEENGNLEPETASLEEKFNAEGNGDDNRENLQIPEASEVVNTHEQSSGTKISLGTGETVGSSARTEEVSESKFKSGLDQKLKSGKSRFALNTEALSTLIKESESKKADVMKALETSAKLKSAENTKYAEYQKKRAEKLASLKDKLKERKAKILQQYRQELLDALSKCDDEVERNLKRREIFEDLSQLEEFQDFVDKDKLAYIMMHRPVNYVDKNEETDEAGTEDRRYYPQIEMVQPLRSPRVQKIPSKEPARYFYGQKTTQFFPSSEGSSESGSESIEPISRSRYDGDDSYYAIVESIENPMILHKKHFHELQRNGKPEKIDFDHEMTVLRPKKYNDLLPMVQYPRNYDYEKYLPRQQPLHRVHAGDDPAFNPGEQYLRAYNDALSSGYVLANKYPPREEESWGLQDMRHREIDDPWNPMIQEAVLHHRQYPGTIYPESRRFEGGKQYLKSDQEAKKSFDGATELGDQVPISEEQPSNVGLLTTRNGRHLVPYEEQIPEGPSFEIVRKQREVKDKQSNYICLKEDSGEDLVEDENRLFRLIRSEDHFQAVPVSGQPEDLGPRKQRKVERVARHGERVRNKRRRYSGEVLTDEQGNYYQLRRNLPMRQDPENAVERFQNKKYTDETDYRLIGDKMNRLESDPMLSPEGYELLMLIPVKKNKVKRQKRELDNTIDRSESYEDMNEVWGDLVNVKQGENKLQEYLDEKEKTVRDLEDAEANVNKYLQKLGKMRDPLQLEKFDRFIMNLGSPDQKKMTVIAKSQDDLDRVHRGEYLKQEVLKKVHGEQPSTPAPEAPETTESLFDEAMPKLEGVINGELEKVEKLTESFEDFMEEFDQKFNATRSGIEIEIPEKKQKISYNIFHTAINNVKKFFDFLSGIAMIFHRH